MSKQIGPKLRIIATCSDCIHVRNDYYAVQGDSGFKVSCAYPPLPSPQRIGDSCWQTPDWCPLYAIALEKLVREATPG